MFSLLLSSLPQAIFSRASHPTSKSCILKGAEVIPAPAAAAVTKKHVQKCLTTATNDIQWFILSAKSCYSEHLHLHSTTTITIPLVRYVAPEYTNSFLLNEKSDIYSFGVVLVEAISRRDPMHYARQPTPEGLKTQVYKLRCTC